MLNEELMTPQQKRIFALELKIKEFKKYDQKRQTLMNKLQGDLEEYSQKYLELKEFVESMQDGTTILELRQKVNTLKKEVKRLSSNTSTISEAKQEKMQKLIKDYQDALRTEQLKKNNKELRKQIKVLRSSNEDLIIQLCRIKNADKKEGSAAEHSAPNEI